MGGGGGGVAGAALREAAARGDLPRLATLLRDNPKIVNETDESGCTALQRSAADGHSEAVALLLQHGADPDRQDNVHGNTALHEAAWKGYSRCARLLAARSKPHVRNRGGFAPLHLACQNGHNQTCREILLAGCDPDVQNNYGDTSLHTSARYGHAGVTRILISAECHVSDQNKNGDTALHIAAAMGRRKLTRILLEAGSNKLLKNKQNETPKDIAVRKELVEIIDILNMSSSKPRKETKKKEKGHREKSVERVIDGPDGVVDLEVIRRVKDNHQSPNKHKEKRKGKNVHFETNARHWSPYGCHYYPDPKNFPKPNLDSLPKEPLKKGEQYYLDLAGNICKGPVGVGYTCYCAPFFRHMEDKLNRDKQELKQHIDKAHERLDQKVTSLELKTQGQISELTRCVAAERVLCRERQQHLEQWLTRGIMFRASERVRKLDFSPKGSEDIVPLKRTQSLEMLDSTSKTWNIIRSFNDKIFTTENEQGFRKSLRKTSKSADVLDGDISKKTGAIKKQIFKNKDSTLSDHKSDISNRLSVKSSDKSVAGSHHSRGNYMKTSRTGSESSHNVTAEIHEKPNRFHLSQSPSKSEHFQLSESDDKYSFSSKQQNSVKITKPNYDMIKNEKSFFENQKLHSDSMQIKNYETDSGLLNEQNNLENEINTSDLQKQQNMHCFDGIENDGYIKIPKHARCDENVQESKTSSHRTDQYSGSNPKLTGIPSADITNIQESDTKPNESLSRKSVQELVAKIQEQQFIDEINRISRSPVRDTKSPVRSFDGSIGRPLSPNYLNSPSKSSSVAWQGNSIPLSDSTHFNTIEPINSPVVIQPNRVTPSKTEQNVKSSKKFSFHNLIPFPSRKMFNFQQKSDGNKSESSDEEDTPIRSSLEPGLMKNSNLLTTLPLPNYENMVSGQSAQPQIPHKTNTNGHCLNQINHMALRGSLLPIPKDAYFHDISNRQRLHDNPPNSRMLVQYQPSNHVHPQTHHHFNNSAPFAQHCYNNMGQISLNDNNPSNYGRNRSTVYNTNNLLSEMMHDHINRELSRAPHAYNNHNTQIPHLDNPNVNDANMQSNFIRRFPQENMDCNQLHPVGNHYQSHGMLPNEVQNPLDGQMLPVRGHSSESLHIQNRLQNLAINTHLSELQSQLDRDSHNDSGYSTKVYGSSQGASPSLSGNVDCSENMPNQKSNIAINRNTRGNVVSQAHLTHIGASSLV